MRLPTLLDERFQGRGIISRALAKVLEHAFTDLAFNRIELRCIVTNTPSRRVAERAGFVLEGQLRQAEFLDGRFQDDLVYSLLASEYRQRIDA